MSTDTDGTVPGSTVPVRLKHAVVAAIWIAVLAPVVVLSVAGSVAIAATLVQLGLAGDLTLPLPTLDEQVQLLAVVGLLALLGLVVWLAVRVTFGPETVDESVEAGAETVETAHELTDDD